DPTFLVRADGDTLAALFLTAPATVDVRPRGTGALEGSVTPMWDDGAVRLALRRNAEPPLRTDVFARTATGSGPPRLTRGAQTVLDVRGTYRADVRDAGGAAVGWVRVRISPYQAAPRIYDGVLPRTIGEDLVAATAAALDSEVDWIEDHALDVYRGT